MALQRGGHIVIVVQNLSVPLDRRVWLECRALVGAGRRVSVICPRGPGEAGFEVLDGVRIHRYAPPSIARGVAGYLNEFVYCWLRTALCALSIWRRERFHVLQACNPPDTYFALALLFRPLGCRFVYDQHDLCPELYLSRFARPSRLLHGALRLLERCTYATADHVVSTNESYRRTALERGRCDPQRVSVVRNGPDPLRMRRGESRPELRCGRRFLLCYLGVMGPQDGVHVILEALDVLVRRRGRDDVHVALLGFGDCLDELKETARRLGLADRVTFAGRADDAMIGDYLSTADIGLSPDPLSPLNDVSTMNKTMEYMAYELPVVSFELRETRVSAQDAAVYVVPNDVAAYAQAIDELLDDPERRAAMGRAGRRRVEDVLAWDWQVPGYIAVYETLAADAELGRVSRRRGRRSGARDRTEVMSAQPTERPPQRVAVVGAPVAAAAATTLLAPVWTSTLTRLFLGRLPRPHRPKRR